MTRKPVAFDETKNCGSHTHSFGWLNRYQLEDPNLFPAEMRRSRGSPRQRDAYARQPVSGCHRIAFKFRLDMFYAPERKKPPTIWMLNNHKTNDLYFRKRRSRNCIFDALQRSEADALGSTKTAFPAQYRQPASMNCLGGTCTARIMSFIAERIAVPQVRSSRLPQHRKRLRSSNFNRCRYKLL